MAIFPGADYRPVSGLANDRPIMPVGCVLHVRDGEGDSLFPYFNGPSGGIESTWYITYKGKIEQYRDSLREADANYHGNSWQGTDGKWYGLHSIETEGFANGTWTQAQIDAIKNILLWDSELHKWPLQISAGWNKPGVGYHIMWGAPGPWTPHNKSCPGPNRIKQFKEILVPWFNNPQEDDVNLADKIEVYNPQDGSRPTITVQEALRRASYTYDYLPILKGLIVAQNNPERIAAAVAKALPAGTADQATVEAAVRSVLGSLDNE